MSIDLVRLLPLASRIRPSKGFHKYLFSSYWLTDWIWIYIIFYFQIFHFRGRSDRNLCISLMWIHFSNANKIFWITDDQFGNKLNQLFRLLFYLGHDSRENVLLFPEYSALLKLSSNTICTFLCYWFIWQLFKWLSMIMYYFYLIKSLFKGYLFVSNDIYFYSYTLALSLYLFIYKYVAWQAYQHITETI